jgi:hypothetical protein
MRRQMKRHLRRRTALRGLGAVVGETLEYFMPASIVTAVSNKQTVAFCARDAESFISTLEYQNLLAERKAARAKSFAARLNDPTLREQYGETYAAVLDKKAKGQERAAKTKEKAGSEIKQTLDEIRKDVAELRAQGIKGPIPMCMYRATGRFGKGLKAAEQKATVNHERFHAESRREEVKAGVNPYSCDANVAKVLAGDLPPELLAFSRRHWTTGRAAAEEILARVEEVNGACGIDDRAGCDAVVGRINDWFLGQGKPELAGEFAKVTLSVKAKHGSSRDVMRAACRITAGK